MNRHVRRAAKAKGRRSLSSKHHRVAAIHEAGHAVAKVLAAAEMGYEVNDAISYIEMGVEAQGHMSADGKMLMFSEAVTFGPTLTKEIALAAAEFTTAYRARAGDRVRGSQNREFLAQVIERARAAGADIGKWFRARAFIAVAGPVAEAIFLNRSFGELFWEDYASESDRRGTALDAGAAGISVNEAISTVSKMAVLAAYLMQDERVWSAVQKLANRLSTADRMSGLKAVDIITSITSADELTAAFSNGLGDIARLEAEIAAGPIVTASYPDGSKTLIKGIDRLTGQETVTSVRYECKLPIFGEILWHAFGDGARQKDNDRHAA
jgi:hypothetical protein